MKGRVVAIQKRCGTCLYYETEKKLVVRATLVEVSKMAACSKTFQGSKVGSLGKCKNYVRDPRI